MQVQQEGQFPGALAWNQLDGWLWGGEVAGDCPLDGVP